MQVAEAQFLYHCSRSVTLYSQAIRMAEKANLADIFDSLKSRRLKLLGLIARGETTANTAMPPLKVDNLPDLLHEIQSNEEQLIKVSTRILKGKRGISLRFKEFVRSAIAEIRSSLHWLDIISSYYKKRHL